MTRRSTQLVFALGLAAWITGAAISWLSAPPLGHDEAQYALAATDLLAGAPPRWPYLSEGMNAIAVPGILAGGSERALHVLPVLIGVGFVLAAFVLARRAAGAVTAAWVVPILAATISMATRSADLLSDLPAAAGLLAGTAVIVGELTRDGGPRWRLVAAAPWLAAAFYVRYGSCIPIAAIGAGAIAVGARAIARRPAPVIATVAVFAVLLIPHMMHAAASTGSPLGFLLESSSAIQRGVSGTSFGTYLTRNPLSYYGILTTPVVLAGVLSILRRRDRRAVMVWVIAVGGFVGIGLTPIPQARYLYFPIVLFAILGVDLIVRWIAARPPRLRIALGRAAAVAVAVGWIAVAWGVRRQSEARRTGLAGTLAAVEAIRADAAGVRCYVVCRHTTQTEWYSGCSAAHEAPVEAIGRDLFYAVRDVRLGEDQPSLDAMPGRHRTILDRPGLVTVIRLE